MIRHPCAENNICMKNGFMNLFRGVKLNAVTVAGAPVLAVLSEVSLCYYDILKCAWQQMKSGINSLGRPIDFFRVMLRDSTSFVCMGSFSVTEAVRTIQVVWRCLHTAK